MVDNKNVFYCRDCTVAMVSVADGPVQCEKCKKEMTNIGWMETDGKDEDDSEKD